MTEQQFCIYTSHEDFIEVCTWMKENDLKREHHLNRTRFWVPQDKMQEFMMSYYYACARVEPNEDLATGMTRERPTYFICGEGGPKDELGLPLKLLVCPAHGADGFAIYTKTKEYDAPSY